MVGYYFWLKQGWKSSFVVFTVRALKLMMSRLEESIPDMNRDLTLNPLGLTSTSVIIWIKDVTLC